LQAAADGHESFEKTVQISEGESLDVSIPALTPVAGAGSDEEPRDAGRRPASDNTTAYIVGAVGLAAIGVGSYFGLRALSEKKTADRDCSATCMTTKAAKADENAVFNGWLSTGAFTAGFVALGVATYLYLDSDTEEAAPGSRAGADVGPVYTVSPRVGPRHAGVDFSATF
jgi:hypothetical protein